MTRTFAQIECGLPHSRKIASLDHAGRWAYLCAHLSPLGGYIGLFRYPKSIWADDAGLSLPQIQQQIAKMIDAGLVACDQDEGFVWIKGWFLKKNAPENASRMSSMAADILATDAPDDLLMMAAAEFAVGSVKRAQRWKPDSPDLLRMRDVFKPFLATMRTNFEDDFGEHILEQLEGQNKAVRAELFSLMPTLELCSEARWGGPTPHPAATIHLHETTRDRNLDEQKTEKRKEKTGKFSENANADLSTKSCFAKKGDALPQTKALAKRLGAI